MHWGTLIALWPTAIAVGLAMAARAEGQTLNCGKAQGEVEKLICGDTALLALNHQLDTAYRAALIKASGSLAPRLRREQRGWVKGRNDCWKTRGQQTWITATWTVDTVRACVDGQTRVRISELQAVWRLLPPRTVAFSCQGNAANEVVANSFDTDPPTIRLERGDQTKTLWRVGLASEGRYEGQNASLVLQASALKLSWLDTNSGKTDEWQCVSR